MATDRFNEVIDMPRLEAERPLPLLTEEAENYHLPVCKQLLCLFVADIFQKMVRALFPKVGCSNQFYCGLLISANILAPILMLKLVNWLGQRRG